MVNLENESTIARRQAQSSAYDGVLHRPQGSGDASRNSDLGVDMQYESVDGHWRDLEPVSDLARRETFRRGIKSSLTLGSRTSQHGWWENGLISGLFALSIWGAYQSVIAISAVLQF